MSRKEGTKNLKNSTTGKGNVLVPYVLVFIVAFLRVELVNSLNVVPVFSCLLFFAASRPAREFALPLSLLVGVDVFLTTYRYGYPLTGDAVVTWMWYLIAMSLGYGLLRYSRSSGRVAGCSLLGSVSFFLASNCAVWAAWQMYPKSLAGLGACYVAGLPFFRNSGTSELCFSLLIFGLADRVRSLTAARVTRRAVC